MPRKPPSLLDDLVNRLTGVAQDFIEDVTTGLADQAEEAARQMTGSQRRAQTNARGGRAQSRAAGRQQRDSPTHYDILGVSKEAPLEVIQAAYKALSRKHHPDAGGNPEEMKRINQAWGVLRDPLKRSLYDRTLG